jgi:hypothetical protein
MGEVCRMRNRDEEVYTEINGRGNPLRWPRDTLYPQMLALTSPTSGCRSVGIVRLWTKNHGAEAKKDLNNRGHLGA